MDSKPIIFSTPMVQAILAGRKSMTRRVVKPQPTLCPGAPICPGPEEILRHSTSGSWYCATCGNDFDGLILRYQPGDTLWVRETWQMLYSGLDEFPPEERWIYKASDNLSEECTAWRPSIFMPKSACRIFLRVTDVRVERVQAISEEDALLEGCIATSEIHD